MRRKEREMGREFGLSVIDKAEYAVVSMVDAEGNPYGVPMSVVRLDDSVYLHSARSGKKMVCLAANASVHLTFVGDIQRAEPFSSDVIQEAKAAGKMGPLTGKMFTTEFESAMIWGQAVIVEDAQEKTEALMALSQKYVPACMDHFDDAMVGALEVTTIIRVSLENVSAKRLKYDEKREEMKWGRME